MFDKDNFMWMLLGLAVMAVGFILMAGGRSSDPNVFNKDEVYGFRRITVAPFYNGYDDRMNKIHSLVNLCFGTAEDG